MLWGIVPKPHDQTRDLAIRYRPARFSDLCNAESSGAVKKIVRYLSHGTLPNVCIFNGPYSSGKTTAGLLLGQWCSCQRWEESKLSCGECDSCLVVRLKLDRMRCKFLTIDGTANLSRSDIEEIWKTFGYFSGDLIDPPVNGNPRPNVLFVDEVRGLSPALQQMFLVNVEAMKHGIVVFATTALDQLDGGLRSRGQIFSFKYPTVEEIVPRLIQIADQEGFLLEREAAKQMATICAPSGRCVPRDVFAVLQNAMSFERPQIDMSILEEILAEK